MFRLLVVEIMCMVVILFGTIRSVYIVVWERDKVSVSGFMLPSFSWGKRIEVMEIFFRQMVWGNICFLTFDYVYILVRCQTPLIHVKRSFSPCNAKESGHHTSRRKLSEFSFANRSFMEGCCYHYHPTFGSAKRLSIIYFWISSCFGVIIFECLS